MDHSHFSERVQKLEPISDGIGTCAGCRGFTGPVPPPLSMSGIYLFINPDFEHFITLIVRLIPPQSTHVILI